MLSVGARAPEFTLSDQDERDVSLTGLLNRGSLILYFYPADFTRTCTREACNIRDIHHDVVKSGLSLAGVSPQNPESHRRFRERYKLPFPLLSDKGKAVIKMYDLNGPLGIGVRRGTYLIDRGRYIRGAVLADFLIERHEDFIRKALALAR